MDKHDELDFLFPKKDDNTVPCVECGITCSGLLPYREHRKSQKHQKCVARKLLAEIINSKLDSESKIDQSGDIDKIPMRKPFGDCPTCKKEFSGAENYYQHMKSQAHKNKVSALKRLNQLKIKEKVEGNQASATQNEQELLKDGEPCGKEAELECEKCSKVFSGVIPYLTHMASKIHEKKLLKIEMLEEFTRANPECDIDENGVLYCKVCSFVLSGIESALLHIKTKKHLHKCAIRKYKKEQEELKPNQQNPNESIPQNPVADSSESKDGKVQTLAKDKVEDEPKDSDNNQPSGAAVVQHSDHKK